MKPSQGWSFIAWANRQPLGSKRIFTTTLCSSLRSSLLKPWINLVLLFHHLHLHTQIHSSSASKPSETQRPRFYQCSGNGSMKDGQLGRTNLAGWFEQWRTLDALTTLLRFGFIFLIVLLSFLVWWCFCISSHFYSILLSSTNWATGKLLSLLENFILCALFSCRNSLEFPYQNWKIS